jgi:hypothetical protein
MMDDSIKRPSKWIVTARILLTGATLVPISAFAVALLNLSGNPVALVVAAPPIALGVRMCTSRNRSFVLAVCLMDICLFVAFRFALQCVGPIVHVPAAA